MLASGHEAKPPLEEMSSGSGLSPLKIVKTDQNSLRNVQRCRKLCKIMIFFLEKAMIRPWYAVYREVLASSPTDGSESKQNTEETPSVEDCYDFMKISIWKTARSDKDCQDIMAQALDRFGIWFAFPGKAPSDKKDISDINAWFEQIDPSPKSNSSLSDCFSRSEMAQIIEDIFYYWAHPSIGNIITSPRLRPPHVSSEDPTAPIRENWRKCECISDADKGAIGQISGSKLFQRFDQAARDQVRIVKTEVELARAVVGEITCVASRRLEKILALRLCSSELLRTNLSAMIWHFFEGEFLADHYDKFRNCEQRLYIEYLGWYFFDFSGIRIKIEAHNTPAEQIRSVNQNILLMMEAFYNISRSYGGQSAASSYTESSFLADTAAMKDPVSSDQITKEERLKLFRGWKKFPVQIQLILLINDIQKMVFQNEILKAKDKNAKVSLHVEQEVSVRFKVREWQKGDELRLNNVLDKFAWSWSRDETNEITIAYRKMLCPLWGGPSGHVISALTAWKHISKDRYDPGAICIASFALWRLYYDKRISVVHTLVESLEEAYCEYNERCFNVAPAKLLTREGDIFAEIKGSGGPGPIDPFSLLLSLEHSYDKFAARETSSGRYRWLLGEINKLRSELDQKGFLVPQWTWDLSSKRGLAVESVAKHFGMIRLSTDLPDDTSAEILAYLGASGVQVGHDGTVDPQGCHPASAASGRAE